MSLSPAHRDAWIEVDLGAIVANVASLRTLLPERTGLLAVVKADGYGHGAVEVARALAPSVAAFGVATLDEALALRSGGIDGRILVFYDVPSGAIREAVAAGLELSVGSQEALRACLAIGTVDRRWLHLKIDTGMSRQGLRLADIGDAAADLRRAAPGIAGIWTHLRNGADNEVAAAQRTTFDDAVTALAALGVSGERHVSASAAILAGSVADETFARAGLALFGALPDETIAAGRGSPVVLQPAMSVHARAIRVVDVPAGTSVGYGGTFVTGGPSRLATLPLGYGDGLPRSLGNGVGHALVHGRTVPIVGRVSMDSVVVDVTDVPDVNHGTRFLLLGTDGEAVVTLESLAASAGTISHELAVRLGSRLPRRYG